MNEGEEEESTAHAPTERECVEKVKRQKEDGVSFASRRERQNRAKQEMIANPGGARKSTNPLSQDAEKREGGSLR